MRTTCRGHWVPCSRHALGFSAGTTGLSSSAVRLTFRRAFILPRASRLLQSTAATDLPFAPDSILRPNHRRKSASHGVLVPHRGINQRRLPFGRESQPHRHVPSSAFLTPSTVYSATSLCGFVSPRCHVQGLPFRGLSLTAEPYGVSPAESCPRVVERTRLRFDPRQPVRPRLQGLAPRAECGADRGCLDPDRSAPLLGFCSPGYSLHATWQPLQATSALDLRCEEPLAADPRRFAVARIGLPGIRLPPRSSFLA